MVWDADLLQRFRDGEPRALAEIFRAHAEPLARALRAMAFGSKEFPRLRWQVDIENTVLETFARAFEPRARAVYDGIRPYAYFLTGIARNVLYEQARVREYASGISADELHASPGSAAPATESSAAELYEDRELLVLLQQFDATLDPAERQLFALRFDQAVAQEAAADQLGLSRIQLRRRELALKKKLVEFLRSHGYLGEVELRQWTFVRRTDP